jgi:hypothetical protein
MAGQAYKGCVIRVSCTPYKSRWMASAVILKVQGHSVLGDPIFLPETFATEAEAEFAAINAAKARIDKQV